MNKIIEYEGNFYKVYFKHIRRTRVEELRKTYYWVKWKNVVPSDITYCYIENISTKEIVAEGMSKCSKEDRFVKEIGRQISLTRALLKIDDEILQFLLASEYFKNKPLKSDISQLFILDLQQKNFEL